jgi:DNA-binding ferritin-like protein (Dps family)
MTMFISKLLSKVIGPKHLTEAESAALERQLDVLREQWPDNESRGRSLPPSYRTALDALERYLNYLGPGGYGGAILADLLDLFEQGAASRTPIREIVGADPVEFIEAFVENYAEGRWTSRERERFNTAIETIEREQENR